jgi:hypothetical protein
MAANSLKSIGINGKVPGKRADTSLAINLKNMKT